jgi:hypothetical protein
MHNEAALKGDELMTEIGIEFVLKSVVFVAVAVVAVVVVPVVFFGLRIGDHQFLIHIYTLDKCCVVEAKEQYNLCGTSVCMEAEQLVTGRRFGRDLYKSDTLTFDRHDLAQSEQWANFQ